MCIICVCPLFCFLLFSLVYFGEESELRNLWERVWPVCVLVSWQFVLDIEIENYTLVRGSCVMGETGQESNISFLGGYPC